MPFQSIRQHYLGNSRIICDVRDLLKTDQAAVLRLDSIGKHIAGRLRGVSSFKGESSGGFRGLQKWEIILCECKVGIRKEGGINFRYELGVVKNVGASRNLEELGWDRKKASK